METNNAMTNKELLMTFSMYLEREFNSENRAVCFSSLHNAPVLVFLSKNPEDGILLRWENIFGEKHGRIVVPDEEGVNKSYSLENYWAQYPERSPYLLG